MRKRERGQEEKERKKSPKEKNLHERAFRQK